jgi:hypothetical protein
VNPINEAVIGHYYRIVLDDGSVLTEADEALDRIESMAADLLPKLADPEYPVTASDVYRLILFTVSLKNRTPQAREALREADERSNELMFEVMLSYRDQYERVMSKHGGAPEDLEAQRLKMLEDLRAGRLQLETTPEREVALMLLGLEEVTNKLFEALGITCLRIPDGSKRRFVLSDHPVSHYDPNPKTPEAGVGFMSTAGSVTWLPLDPRFGVLLGQQHPGAWQNDELSDMEVDELNVQTYAWARDAIYGPSQEAITYVRRTAKRNRALLHELRYRPQRVWVTRGDGRAGPQEFASRFRGETVRRTLHVTEGGMDEANRRAWPPADLDQ